MARALDGSHCRENDAQWFDVDVVFEDGQAADEWLDEDPMTNAFSLAMIPPFLVTKLASSIQAL